VHSDDFKLSTQGTMVYLNGGNDFGHFAHFIDTEGNKVGLHSML
jgi:predicted enzyme related to lactoylglutathione lyase